MPHVIAKKQREEEISGVYTVGEILDEKFEDDGTETNSINLYYLVHWKYFPKSADTWEPQENLQGSPEVLKAWAEKKLTNTKRPQRTKKSVSPVRAFQNRALPPAVATVREDVVPGDSLMTRRARVLTKASQKSTVPDENSRLKGK
jgi:hypothetical protein